MPDQVKVEDLEVFTLFRVAMVKFAQAASQSLFNADSQISRTHSWLDGEQRTFWQGQLRKRSEAAAKAADALRQKKLYKDASGRTPSAAEEEKALHKALAAVEEAKNKLEAIRKWLPRLEKEADMYRGGVARLSKTITGDVPQAVMLLDRMKASLEEYLLIETPDVPLAESAAASLHDGSFSRGGDAAPGAPPAPDGATPPVGGGQSQPPVPKEGRNVAAGQ